MVSFWWDRGVGLTILRLNYAEVHLHLLIKASLRDIPHFLFVPFSTPSNHKERLQRLSLVALHFPHGEQEGGTRMVKSGRVLVHRLKRYHGNDLIKPGISSAMLWSLRSMASWWRRISIPSLTARVQLLLVILTCYCQ